MNTESNHGLIFTPLSTNQEANLFYTTDAADEALRPYLEIDYFEFG